MRPLPSYEAFEESWFEPAPPGTASNLWRRPNSSRLLLFKNKDDILLLSLQKEIERSREMLSWPDDWDDEGSPRFEESTWRKAVEFLEHHARLLLRRGITLPTPRILPGPSGSIDLHWETDVRELLINVPVEGTVAGFYGEATGKNSIKGKVALDFSDLGLFTWLTTTD